MKYYLGKESTIFGEETLAYRRGERYFAFEAVLGHCLHPGELIALVFSFLLGNQWFSCEKVVRL